MLEITWLGHATFQLRLDSGEVILLDPWVEGNPKFPANHQFQRVDAMLISHPHQDHIHGCIPLAKKFKPKTIAIFETALWLGSKGVENLSGMGKGGTQDVVGGVKATMTHAVRLTESMYLLRGNLVADLLRAATPDDRAMIATMIDTLFWNIVVVICAVALFL